MDVFVDIYLTWHKTEKKQGLEDCCTKLQKGRGWGLLAFSNSRFHLRAQKHQPLSREGSMSQD